MRETSLTDNLNYKTQAHTRVCEENEIRIIKMMPIEVMFGLRCEFEGSYM